MLPLSDFHSYVSSMADLNKLQALLEDMGSAVLGYSGGIDSAFLAVMGTRALGPGRFLAVMGRSPSYPAVQAENAQLIAQQFNIPLLEIDTYELRDPRYLSNSTERCYFCKSELWTRLGQVARDGGYQVVLDGTNADDLGEHRPGLRAAGEHRVRSPLAESGWSKADVRAGAHELGIPTWDAPAAPCLSSRVVYGLEITSERLRQVEQAEQFLRHLGVTGDLRVRHHGRKARVEVSAAEMDRVKAQWTAIRAALLELGFAEVELDPEGYRRGGLLAIASPARD
jgi:pyridinium-3,5-biscarboxylic acid mononucleotide sulfurtransferase